MTGVGAGFGALALVSIDLAGGAVQDPVARAGPVDAEDPVPDLLAGRRVAVDEHRGAALADDADQASRAGRAASGPGRRSSGRSCRSRSDRRSRLVQSTLTPFSTFDSRRPSGSGLGPASGRGLSVGGGSFGLSARGRRWILRRAVVGAVGRVVGRRRGRGRHDATAGSSVGHSIWLPCSSSHSSGRSPRSGRAARRSSRRVPPRRRAARPRARWAVRRRPASARRPAAWPPWARRRCASGDRRRRSPAAVGVHVIPVLVSIPIHRSTPKSCGGRSGRSVGRRRPDVHRTTPSPSGLPSDDHPMVRVPSRTATRPEGPAYHRRPRHQLAPEARSQ